MPVRSFPIASLRAGSEDLGRAMLRLRRNDPDPDIPGIKSWLVSGRTEFLGPLPNDIDIVAILVDGRKLAGRVVLTSHTINSQTGRAGFRYSGTGPLDGIQDEDFG